MKTRRHHNNKGLRQIRRGKTREQVRRIAVRLNIPYSEPHKIIPLDPIADAKYWEKRSKL